jgi:flagellar biosynthesis/type III secretory pathway chaperone
MSPNPNNLAEQLHAENAAWAALLATLVSEEKALVAGHADEVSSLTAVKFDRLNAASALTRSRLDALREAGCTPDVQGMETWLARHGSQAARENWKGLRALENEARACNLRIGKLIEMRLSATRKSLNVLMQAAVGRNGLYDPSGQSIPTRASQTLTSA